MSGHHPFQRLVENFSVERKLKIDRKKKEILTVIELRKAVFNTIRRSSSDSSG
jgi:hypothetical protein